MVQHEAERQAWTITPLTIHRHYSLQARLPLAYAAASPAVKWQTIMVMCLLVVPLSPLVCASVTARPISHSC